jgi:heme/copper-type cytochrome/quinol oxidase subunit 1
MAQDTDAVAAQGQPQGFMTAHGKIMVVMVVCLTVLAGLILYIVRLDRKLSRLEKAERK